jgi:predicted MPP superfamily phosphohydrolase
MAKRISRESYAPSDAVGATSGSGLSIAGPARQRLPNSTSQWFDQALEVGLHRALHIREERLSTRHDACRLLYVSDIHLRSLRSEGLCRQVLEAVATCRPDLILLGGDLVDCSSELSILNELVRKLYEMAPVLAVGGNHDERVGMDRVRRAVECAGGQWIHDSTARVRHGDRTIAFSGPEATTCGDGHVRVLCAHNPRSWKASRHIGYDLVLAGHLHGCQIVACELRGRLYPGALLYPNCVLSYQRGSTRLVVSRGVSDLVPIRWRCPREVVLCCV